MDTSKEYILMCEKAEEIQKNWDWVSDFCCLYNKKDKKCYCNVHLCYYVQDRKKLEMDRIFVWLPRQDQLQEMLWNKSSPHAIIKNLSGKFLNGDAYLYWDIFKTFEQLWLALVMKENYNKIWNSAEGHECWAEDFREEGK